MTKLTTAEEIVALRKKNGPFVRCKTPFQELVALYAAYDAEQRMLGTSPVKIRFQFALLCEKKSSWVETIVPLCKLHPSLLARLNKPDKDGFRISLEIALKLAPHPQNEQIPLLEKARNKSNGRLRDIWLYLPRSSQKKGTGRWGGEPIRENVKPIVHTSGTAETKHSKNPERHRPLDASAPVAQDTTTQSGDPFAHAFLMLSEPHPVTVTGARKIRR